MPLPSPAITLQANLATILGGGVEAGYLEITLCGFGPVLPTVGGVLNIDDAGVPRLVGPGNNPSVELFGNDVISPAGTFYSIAILDENKNVIQANNFILTGGGTQNLASLTPVINPPYNVPSGYLIFDPATGAIAVDDNGWNGPITLDFTLTGDATPTLSGFYRGQRVQCIVRQDGTGGHAFTWPANVKNPPAVNPAADSVTTAPMTVDYLGNFYPALGWS